MTAKEILIMNIDLGEKQVELKVFENDDPNIVA